MHEALEGIRVVDFTRHMSGPYGTLLLGDFGADVVKVESMPHGDPTRTMGTAFVDGESGLFLIWNRSKRSMALDMRKPESAGIVRRLVEGADILAENFRPGVAESMGIGYEALSALNARLIYLSITAFGQTGPYARAPGTDPVVQAMSGVMSLTGEAGRDAVLVGIPVADFTSAMVAVQGALLGLLARERTGRGQRVDVPMLAALAFGLTTRLATYWGSGKEPQREGSSHSAVAPYQRYRAKDGDIVAGAWTLDSWPRFCTAVGLRELVDDPRFADNIARMKNRAALNQILDAAFLQRTVAEWEHVFHEATALFGPVLTVPQVLEHPQMQALGLVQSVNHPKLGAIPQLAPPIFMSDTPGGIRRPPPMFGEHTAEVLSELGYSSAEIERFAGTGVVHVPGVTAHG
ncbi:CaiB/BaiF CoA transferase family protein [Variovorax sp. PBL-E5]|uniref:CaiB/BaiF CoA transferase family protein n=1 Tax=Variovorax sp. PBL-E5 TaxID=434014 RepID=UPI001319240B|nr:CoA transferase [Variovorax sp. PBL-E5]VTU37233.1 Formyl-coenzyme A transferase [Variovorax sp. PBL-E5]